MQSQQYLRYRSIQLIINSIGAIGAALPKVSLLYCSIPACYCYNSSTKQYLIRNITSKHILCYFYTIKRQILLFFLITWGASPPTPPNMNIDHVCVWFTYFFLISPKKSCHLVSAIYYQPFCLVTGSKTVIVMMIYVICDCARLFGSSGYGPRTVIIPNSL